MKRIIWDNDIDTSEAGLAKAREEYADDNICVESMDDKELSDFLREEVETGLADECMNLDISLELPVIAIADLGLWNGRRQGYSVLDCNVNSIFGCTCGEYIQFYADAHNVWCEDTHHDGTNYYLFRVLRRPVEECAAFFAAIYRGEKISSSMLNRYTRSILPYVADVYGWPVAGRRKTPN